MPITAIAGTSPHEEALVVHRPAAIVAIAALALAFAGPPVPDRPEPGPPDHAQPGGGPHTDDAPARSVVATVDGFTNPYHEFFDVGDDTAVTDEVLERLGIDEEHVISITRGAETFEAAFEADVDAGEYDGIEAGQPYWFEGTNLVGVSFADDPAERLRPSEDAGTHGVGVTAAVLSADPDAIVVSTQGISADTEEWAFTHPAVDAVNTSYGTPAGEPDVTGQFGPAHTFEGVVEHGKHHFGAVANTPMPSPIDQTGGPWWSIGVAGYQEDSSEGRQLVSGSLADFVGNFTQELPDCQECTSGESSASGTSFASPRAMGTFSRVLREARDAAGHTGGIVAEGGQAPLMVDGELDGQRFTLTNWELRRALEEAAVYPSLSDWDPTSDPGLGLTTAPAVDGAEWSTFGWGVITPAAEAEVVERTLGFAGVIERDDAPKPDEACDYMTAQIEVRERYWNEVEPRSDSAGHDGDAYIRC